MVIDLMDFVDSNLFYRFDVEKKKVETINKKIGNPTGLGSYRKVGICRRQNRFFAVFQFQRKIFFYADDELFNLDERGLCVKRDHYAPFIFRLRIMRNNVVLKHIAYWFSWRHFSEFPILDIFEYVSDFLAVERNKRLAIKTWKRGITASIRNK